MQSEENTKKLVLTNSQQRVLDEVKGFINSDASVFILRGYAGTGKTTMIKQIADYVSQSRDVVLMAPTGRAARVLAVKTGHPASTIHRAIYEDGRLSAKEVKDIAETEFKIHFSISATNGKVVAIVDEASMLSSRTSEQELYEFGTNNLMDDLLTYVRPSLGGKVIFVGDPAQLPPVGDPESQALNAAFFENKGLKVMSTELTEVLRQTGESVILKNAMQIRDLLGKELRNRLVMEEKDGDVENLQPGTLLNRYLDSVKEVGRDNCIVICCANSTASGYNKEIRKALYGSENASLQCGDTLMVVHNNYMMDIMNGEFVSVVSTGNIVQQSAPVYVQEGGKKIRKTITLNFQNVTVSDHKGDITCCLVLLDLLNNEAPSMSIDEQRALYINFCMRQSTLKRGSVEFRDALMNDPYYNCLRVKYGYAVTGHKCQGGEWKRVYADYHGRTGLSNECLRWAYTTTTRAQETLYIANLPHITPFSKFRIEPVQQCAKMNEECRVIGNIGKSPYHDATAPDYLHAKYECIAKNMEFTPYKVCNVVSKPYQEIYSISTPDGIERYDIRYKKGGIFTKATTQTISEHNVMIRMMLDNEHAVPLVFEYTPSNDTHTKLYHLIRSSCDGLGIQITNVVEHKEDYSVVYYFRTSDTISYIKIYINSDGFVTYAKPMSLIGQEDKELITLIEEIKNHFE